MSDSILIRGRFTKCRGCPTTECTCLTDLEIELLEKSSYQCSYRHEDSRCVLVQDHKGPHEL